MTTKTSTEISSQPNRIERSRARHGMPHHVMSYLAMPCRTAQAQAEAKANAQVQAGPHRSCVNRRAQGSSLAHEIHKWLDNNDDGYLISDWQFARGNETFCQRLRLLLLQMMLLLRYLVQSRIVRFSAADSVVTTGRSSYVAFVRTTRQVS